MAISCKLHIPAREREWTLEDFQNVPDQAESMINNATSFENLKSCGGEKLHKSFLRLFHNAGSEKLNYFELWSLEPLLCLQSPVKSFPAKL